MYRKDTGVVITKIGIVNALGLTLEEFRTNVRSPEGVTPVKADWFDAELHLGKRGHKYFTSGTKYGLSTVKHMLSNSDISESYSEAEIGVFTGTNFALYAAHKAMDEVILHQGSDLLDPAECANFSINIPSSIISIKHKFKAFNVTHTTPFTAGLEALSHGAEAIKAGRAKCVFAGSIEDDMPEGVLPEDLIRQPHGGACYVQLEEESLARRRGAGLVASLESHNHCFLPAKLDKHRKIEVILDAINRLEITGEDLLVCLPPSASEKMVENHELIIQAFTRLIPAVSFHRPASIDYSFMTSVPLLQLADALSDGRQIVCVSLGLHGNVSFVYIKHSES